MPVNVISDKKKALVAYKEKILQELRYYDKRIDEIRSNGRKDITFEKSDSSDSESEYPVTDLSQKLPRLKLQQQMLRTCFQATQELTNLQIVESEVNVLTEDPVYQGEPAVLEAGVWREVTAECRVDLVSFCITFFVHQPERPFAPAKYRNLHVTAVKSAHQAELGKSILSTVRSPSDAVEIVKGYAAAHRSRRTTLARLAEKFANTLYMEPMADGGYHLKCANLLEISWVLQNKWSPVAPFHHRMKFELEYMDEAYLKTITQTHRQLNDPSIETDERTFLLSKIISTCLEAQGPTQELYESMSSDPETAQSLRKRRTTLDREPDGPVMKKRKDSEVMAPPKSLPKKAKPKGKENVDADNVATAKKAGKDAGGVARAKKSTKEDVSAKKIDSDSAKERVLARNLTEPIISTAAAENRESHKLEKAKTDPSINKKSVNSKKSADKDAVIAKIHGKLARGQIGSKLDGPDEEKDNDVISTTTKKQPNSADLDSYVANSNKGNLKSVANAKSKEKSTPPVKDKANKLGNIENVNKNADREVDKASSGDFNSYVANNNKGNLKSVASAKNKEKPTQSAKDKANKLGNIENVNGNIDRDAGKAKDSTTSQNKDKPKLTKRKANKMDNIQNVVKVKENAETDTAKDVPKSKNKENAGTVGKIQSNSRDNAKNVNNAKEKVTKSIKDKGNVENADIASSTNVKIVASAKNAKAEAVKEQAKIANANKPSRVEDNAIKAKNVAKNKADSAKTGNDNASKGKGDENVTNKAKSVDAIKNKGNPLKTTDKAIKKGPRPLTDAKNIDAKTFKDSIKETTKKVIPSKEKEIARATEKQERVASLKRKSNLVEKTADSETVVKKAKTTIEDREDNVVNGKKVQISKRPVAMVKETGQNKPKIVAGSFKSAKAGNTERVLSSGNIGKQRADVTKIPQIKMPSLAKSKLRENPLKISPSRMPAQFKLKEDLSKHKLNLKSTNIPRLLKKPSPKS